MFRKRFQYKEGFSLSGLIFGKNETTSKYQRNTSITNNLLSQVEQSVSAELKTSSNSNNEVNIGNVNIDEQNGIFNQTMKIKQDAKSQAAAAGTLAIKAVLNSAASAETKMDALATLSNAIKNSSILKSNKSTSEVDICTTSDTDQQFIKKIAMSFKTIATANASNIVNVGDVNIKKQGSTGVFNREVIIEQQASAMAKALQNIASEVTSIDKSIIEESIKEGLSTKNNIEQKGLLDGFSNIISSVGNLGTPLIIAIVIVIIIFISAPIALLAVLLKNK